jgi:hypothetical protein
MRIVRSGSVVVLLLSACAFFAAAQDSPSSPVQPSLSPTTTPAAGSGSGPAQTTESLPPAARTLNDVLDHVVQREHLFMAQMRHMHPLVETYLQDLKNDANGNGTPVNDKYFLGRLDMTDGPEDVSFVGQPGFGHRMLTKLTGV